MKSIHTHLNESKLTKPKRAPKTKEELEDAIAWAEARWDTLMNQKVYIPHGGSWSNNTGNYLGTTGEKQIKIRKLADAVHYDMSRWKASLRKITGELADWE